MVNYLKNIPWKSLNQSAIELVKKTPWSGLLIGSLALSHLAMIAAPSMAIPLFEIAVTLSISAGYVLATYVSFVAARALRGFWWSKPVVATPEVPLTHEEVLKYGHEQGLENGFRKGDQNGYKRALSEVQTQQTEALENARKKARKKASKAYDAGYDAGYEEADKVGRDEGQQTGYGEGYQAGQQVGRDKGYRKGHKAGYRVGLEEQRLSLSVPTTPAPVPAPEHEDYHHGNNDSGNHYYFEDNEDWGIPGSPSSLSLPSLQVEGVFPITPTLDTEVTSPEPVVSAPTSPAPILNQAPRSKELRVRLIEGSPKAVTWRDGERPEIVERNLLLGSTILDDTKLRRSARIFAKN